jgi:hypothetical protein
MSSKGLHRVVGTVAIGAATLVMLADLIELTSGGFSALQLYMAYVAFAAIPFVMVGLHAVQQPRGGWLSLCGALLYGVSFVFFASTCVYALAAGTVDYAALYQDLWALYTVHGILMVTGGVLFGAAVIRAAVLPAWTGWFFAAGVLLNVVFTLAAVSPAIGVAAAAAVRSLALVGMGIAVLRGLSGSTRGSVGPGSECQRQRIILEEAL